MKKIFLIIFCLIVVNAHSQSPVEIDITGKEKLSSHWEVLNFNKNHLTSKVLTGDYDSLFKITSEDDLLKAPAKFWLKFSIKNTENKVSKFYIGTSKFEFITFYLPDTMKHWQKFTSGSLLPFKQKRINTGPFSFAFVEIKPNETVTCYALAENINTPSFQFANLASTIFTENEFKMEYGNVWIYNLIFLGVVLIMLIYNLLLFFITKENSYLFYLGYMVCILAYVYALSGDMIGRFFTNASKQNDLVLFTGIASLMIYAAFSRKALELKLYYPKWDKAYLVISLLMLVAAILTLLNLTIISIPLCFVAAIITYPSILVIAFRLAFINKHESAKYFFIAATFYILMLNCSFLQMLGILPVSIWGLHANNFTQIGVAIELALFSLALGAKINQMRKEKFEAQQLALEASQENEKIIREQNAFLEQKVYERTAELNNAMNDLKNTQQQLIQNEKLASLGQLTAGIAHEINNPINFVSSNISPLKRDFDDLELIFKRYKESGIEPNDKVLAKMITDMDIQYTFTEIKELLKGIEEGAKRTADIVRGLKTFSRTDEQKKSDYELTEGLEGTILLLNSKLTDKNISINKEYKQIPMIKCYAGKINQVFMNLMSNAIDASNVNGAITIKTWCENENICVSISDNGHGMSNDVKQKIFDPFFTTKDVGSGTGLGLSITYGIIESHNGKIEVDSEVEKGTTFTISLPLN